MPLRLPTFCAVAALAVGLSACAGTSEPARTAEAGKPANATTAEALARIADKSLAAGDPVSAVSMLKRAHEIDPSSSAILAELGRNLGALNAWTEAAEAYRKAAELAPKDPAVLRGYAGALLALNQPALAEPEYRAALALREDAATLCGLGVTLDLQGRHDDAEAAFRRAYQLDPQSAATRANLALSLALWNKSDEAIGLLAPMAAAPDAGAKQRQNLALVFGLAGELDQAAAVARIDLGEEAVRSNLAYYETLRAMAPVERMRAILGASAQPPQPPRKPEVAAIDDSAPIAMPETPASPAVAPRPKRPTPKPSRAVERAAPARVAAKIPASRIPVPEPEKADSEEPVAKADAVPVPTAVDTAIEMPATPAETTSDATATHSSKPAMEPTTADAGRTATSAEASAGEHVPAELDDEQPATGEAKTPVDATPVVGIADAHAQPLAASDVETEAKKPEPSVSASGSVPVPVAEPAAPVADDVAALPTTLLPKPAIAPESAATPQEPVVAAVPVAAHQDEAAP